MKYDKVELTYFPKKVVLTLGSTLRCRGSLRVKWVLIKRVKKRMVSKR